MAAWLVLGAGQAVRAEIYMYRDGSGSLHFSNAPASPGFRRYRPSGGAAGLGDSAWLAGVRERAFDDIIANAALRYGVDAPLIKGIIRAESNFIPYARSRKGALGLMQLMPATARLYNVRSVFDPRENVEGGVRHFKALLNRYAGNVRLALAAYNAGSDAVERYGGVPPFPETLRYVDKVLRFRAQYLGEP